MLSFKRLAVVMMSLYSNETLTKTSSKAPSLIFFFLTPAILKDNARHRGWGGRVMNQHGPISVTSHTTREEMTPNTKPRPWVPYYHPLYYAQLALCLADG